MILLTRTRHFIFFVYYYLFRTAKSELGFEQEMAMAREARRQRFKKQTTTSFLQLTSSKRGRETSADNSTVNEFFRATKRQDCSIFSVKNNTHHSQIYDLRDLQAQRYQAHKQQEQMQHRQQQIEEESKRKMAQDQLYEQIRINQEKCRQYDRKLLLSF